MFDSSWCYFNTINKSAPIARSTAANPKMQHVAGTLATPPKVARFDHSGRLTERKRALFPSQMQDSDDSDIGHMSPLEYSSSPEPLRLRSPEHLDAYDLLPVQESDDSSDAICTGRFSPALVHFSPETQPPKTVTFDSPTEILKTPHDSANTNVKVPRLVRKSLIDITNIDAASLKRKSESPIASPPNKSAKFEQVKTSKARTALFPDSVFPAKSFYPKCGAKTAPHAFIDLTQKVRKRSAKKVPVYLCNRARNQQPKKNFGLINAGVRHKIKKPRLKPALTKTQLLKAALNIVKNSPLNEYFDDLAKQNNECGVSFEQIQKMDSILKNLQQQHDLQERKPSGAELYAARNGVKRSRSPQPDQTKKFFKTGHANRGATVTISSSIKFQMDRGEMCLIEKKMRRPKRETIEFDPNDFSLNEETTKMNDCSFSEILNTLVDPETSDVPEHSRMNPEHSTIIPRMNSEHSTIIPRMNPEHSRIIPRMNPEHSRIIPRMNPEHSRIIPRMNPEHLRIIPRMNPDHSTIIPEHSRMNPEHSRMIPEHSRISTTPPLENARSGVKSENQIQPHPIYSHLIDKIDSNVLLSPTSLVCDLTSGLALDSPKNQPLPAPTLDKLSTLKKRISFPEHMDNPKLFPIFCGKQNEPPKPVPKESKHVKNIRKIWKPLSENQTLIDAGQKKYGLTQCPDCKCVYSLGEPEDEITHFKHHNSVAVLRYSCWKHERVVNHFSGGKIIQVNPNDPKPWIKKVKDLLEVVNRELGFVDVPFNMINQKVFLCIMNKQIVGCLVAEPKTNAFKMLPNQQSVIDQCTEESFPVKCGVSRLWVAATHRNKGVATCLMNVMRSNFMYGHILSGNEIAFSAPTEAGKKFASKYTKTEAFLIYTS